MTDTHNQTQDLSKGFNADSLIGIYKSNVGNWRKGLIEVATDMAPSYVVFKIEINNVIIPSQLIGFVKEIWFWTDDYGPSPVVHPTLSEWQAGTAVQISFGNKHAKFDGSMSKV